MHLQLTGTALSAAKRFQFNLDVTPLPQVEIMKNMPTLVFPMFWIEESVRLDKDMTDHMKNSMFLYVDPRFLVEFSKKKKSQVKFCFHLQTECENMVHHRIDVKVFIKQKLNDSI